MSHIFWSCPVVVQKIYLKRSPVSCTNTHHGIIDFENKGMVKNAKTRLFWEQKINFLWYKKLFNLSLFLHFWEHLFSRTPSSSQNSYMYCGGKTLSSSRQRCLFNLGWSPFQRWYHNKISYGVDVLRFMLTSSPSFSRGLVKIESE